MSGYYTEQYFPEHNVRYIALLDNIDTCLYSSNNEIFHKAIKYIRVIYK